jgi:threonine dehydratase
MAQDQQTSWQKTSKARKTIMAKELREQLFEETLRARERVYHINKPTPLETASISGIDAQIYMKREDLSSINSYKWRGAYNCLVQLGTAEREKPVVAASAGNHAQGVALGAKMSGIKARIYMPLSTPLMKQIAVKNHGGDSVEIILTGDTYNEAATQAHKYAEDNDCTYIHPFDNIYTIAGQATIADEIVLSGQGPFDYAFIQIGGGGLAAGVATWLKIHYPDIKIIGVEGEGQASMKASIDAGKIVTLEEVDGFCDGTAVTHPGKLCFEVCNEVLDEIITVTNEEVCAAIQTTWELKRFVPEPSGAMGFAGLMKYARLNLSETKDKKLVSLICGANMDFSKLGLIASNSAIGNDKQHFLRFSVTEERGSLLDILENYFEDVNVNGFLYGKVSENKAWPVISCDAPEKILADMLEQMKDDGIECENITGQVDARYKVINYDPELFKNPLIINIHFPERHGALRDLLKSISGIANICYFNYAYTGESIGRALMAFEFETADTHQEFLELIEKTTVKYSVIDEKTAQRIIYTENNMPSGDADPLHSVA